MFVFRGLKWQMLIRLFLGAAEGPTTGCRELRGTVHHTERCRKRSEVVQVCGIL